MKVEKLVENSFLAEEKYREYAEGYKKTRDPLFKELKAVYYAIKKGKQVTDIFTAIRAGGVRAGNEPNLAICRADVAKVACRYSSDGTVKYASVETISWRDLKADIILKNCLPAFTPSPRWNTDLRFTAPVPIIPPKLRPLKLTSDYFILWEVDSWTLVPSRDPYLLRRISTRQFVICAAWDLTDIELAVMAGRVK